MTKGSTIVFVTHEPDIARFATRNVIFGMERFSARQYVTERLFATEYTENTYLLRI